MNVGIDNSPLVSTHKLSHKIRGTGFYTKNLIDALQKYHSENKYILFVQGRKINDKIDVFHFPYFEPFFLSLPFVKQGNTIVTIHDLTPLLFPRLFPVGIKGTIKYKIQKVLAKKADAIITDSISSKRDIERLLLIPEKNVFAIPLAAATHFKKVEVSSKEKDSILKKYKIPEKFALYVGDATPNKNLKRLVNSSIKANIPLVMVGGALTKKDIDRVHPWNTDIVYVQERANYSSLVNLIGFVEDSDLVTLYNIATVFVFPSLYEGFGLPVLEAASCGCPVITSKRGSLEEVMGESAMYINPENEEEITRAIKEVFDSKKIQEEYSKKGLAQAKKFSWKMTADKTVQVYEKVSNKT